jgi:hypothetical protein
VTVLVVDELKTKTKSQLNTTVSRLDKTDNMKMHQKATAAIQNNFQQLRLHLPMQLQPGNGTFAPETRDGSTI